MNQARHCTWPNPQMKKNGIFYYRRGQATRTSHPTLGFYCRQRIEDKKFTVEQLHATYSLTDLQLKAITL